MKQGHSPHFRCPHILKLGWKTKLLLSATVALLPARGLLGVPGRHWADWHPQAELGPQRPGPMPTFPVQGEKMLCLGIGSPRGEVSISAR